MIQHLNAFLLVSFIAISYAVSPADIMIDSEETVDSKEVNNAIEKEDIKFQNNNNICHMEVQITRRILGYCIKHGLASHSCVADGYLHPFHRECLTV